MTLEQPELEERHQNLVTSIATDQKQLLDIEDQILRLLNDAGSGVKVLDDEVCFSYFCARSPPGLHSVRERATLFNALHFVPYVARS